jgi:hypothetical protein
MGTSSRRRSAASAPCGRRCRPAPACLARRSLESRSVFSHGECLDYGQGSFLNVEVAAPPGDFGAELASRVFDALERHLSRGSCYRGRVLSLETSPQWTGHAARIRVHSLEPVAREEVILPDITFRALERNVLRFAEQRPALRAMGLSTQKGLLSTVRREPARRIASGALRASFPDIRPCSSPRRR